MFDDGFLAVNDFDDGFYAVIVSSGEEALLFAQCPAAVAKVRHAIKSTQGALRFGASSIAARRRETGGPHHWMRA